MSLPVPSVVVIPASTALPDGLDRVVDMATVHVARSVEDLARWAASADVVVVYDFNTTLIRDLGVDAAAIPWIHTCFAGVDAVTPPAVLAAGRTTVTNARGISAEPIAEWILAVLLAWAKDLPRTIELQASRTWQHRDSRPVRGGTVLIYGAGTIGSATARLLRAVGMTVIGVARSARPDDPDYERVVADRDLEGVLPQADHVVCCAPLTDATRGRFGAEAFALMREGATFTNIGRGAVVDDGALIDALDTGRVRAASLDVFPVEPLPQDSSYWDRADVLVSPHMSGDEEGWERRHTEQFVDLLEKWRHGRPLDNVQVVGTPQPWRTAGGGAGGSLAR